jgi:endonuclease YncB( thermonuclease family)
MRLKNRNFLTFNRMPKRRLRLLDIGLAIGIIGLSGLIAMQLNSFSAIKLAGRAQIVDGDTLRIDGQRIRLWGLDAPELGQSCQAGGRTYRCGLEAQKFLETIIRGRDISCGGRDYDRYGRLLAVCHLGKTDINGAAVSAGWAVSYGGYHGEERAARENARGIWAGRFDWPKEWRDTGGIPPGNRRGFIAGLGRGLRRLFGVAND